MSRLGIQRWLVVQAFVWGLGIGFTAVGGGAENPREFIGCAAGVMVVSYVWLWRALGVGRRVADWATLARFAGLIGVSIGVAFTGRITWAIWGAALVVVCADLVDGWCARKWGGSVGGAVLDMETDQFTTLALALIATLAHGVGAWILLLPAFRYLNVGALTMLRVPAHDPKPCDGDNKRGRVICALMLSLLLLVCLPTAPAGLSIAAGWTAIALLAYSYASDARFLWRRLSRAPTAP